jgi:hypothetical protein
MKLFTKLKVTAVIIVVIVISLAAWAGYAIGYSQGKNQNINTYEECADAGYPIQDSYPERCVLPNGTGFTKKIDQPAANQTFEGKVVCLPHKNMDGPHTLECAIGLQTDDGTYYGLTTNETGGELSMAAGSDKRYKVTGALDATPSDKYQSVGNISVADYQAL